MRYWIVFSFFLFSCGGSTIPEEVLPPEKMREVLYDVIRVDELVDFRRMADSTYRPFSKRAALYDTVFGLHGVTKKTFQRSLEFYQGRPDLLKEMVNDLHAEITDTTKKPKPRALQMAQ